MSKPRPALTPEIIGGLLAVGTSDAAGEWLTQMRAWVAEAEKAHSSLREVHAMHMAAAHADEGGHSHNDRIGLVPLIDDCRVCVFLGEQFDQYQL